MRKPLPLLELFNMLATVFGGLGISARLGLTERRLSQVEKSLNRQRFMLYLLVGMNLALLGWEYGK